MTAESSAVADLSGRPLGVRALAKRRRLLDATCELLAERGLRELRVADIARAVGASPATFYQYFADVEDAVLHLAAEANDDLAGLHALFDGPWRGSDGRRQARAIVEFFMAYWDRHGPLLRVRNLAADEGDMRFMELRRAAMEPILGAMVALMTRCGVAARHPLIDPDSAALAMSAILDRLAAYHTVVEFGGVSREDLVNTSAEILFRTLTGK